MQTGTTKGVPAGDQRGAPLRSRVARLEETVRLMEEERVRLARRRRRQLLIVGAGVSLVLHVCLMLYLATRYRLEPGSAGPTPVSYEFAILQEEELTELEATELDDLLPEVVDDVTDVSAEVSADLDPVVADAEIAATGAGSLPTLGGSGEGTGADGGLAGGGAGATFFGVSARGMRFAYIVDRSGSMEQGRKMEIAMRELARSVGSLPDYAYFTVVLFSTATEEPPMQKGWMRAKRTTINRLIRWLGGVEPGGGTVPMPAFFQVFALDVRPDVVFFLTDGEIPDDTADQVAEVNRRGGRVVVNTIAFGDATSQDQLRRIARDSGGVYRFVSAEGG